MEIPSETKPGVLLEALKERYTSMHKIRDRVQGIGIWALGILFAASGWLLQSDALAHFLQKLLSLIAVAVGFYVLRFKYLQDLRKGFRGQQRAAANLEEALGFYETGAYVEGKTLYEEKWRLAGTSEGDGKFFETSYALLYVAVAFLVVAILFSGAFSNSKPHEHHHERASGWTYSVIMHGSNTH